MAGASGVLASAEFTLSEVKGLAQNNLTSMHWWQGISILPEKE